MGSEKVVFLVIFIHPFENSGGYFFRGRLFWWILDINLQNFVRGYFLKFSLRALILCISMAYYKVIEWIVFTQNTHILKIAVFAEEHLRNHQK